MHDLPWVCSNPSVHGFVFERSVFIWVETTQSSELMDTNENCVIWQVEKTIGLGEFFEKGVIEKSLMICPLKWNHLECDDLCVCADEAGECHLIAWNASEATTHSGNVQGLALLLTQLATRQDTSIHFSSVCFLFIVP